MCDQSATIVISTYIHVQQNLQDLFSKLECSWRRNRYKWFFKSISKQPSTLTLIIRKVQKGNIDWGKSGIFQPLWKALTSNSVTTRNMNATEWEKNLFDFLIETFGYKSQNAEITANMGATDWENWIRLVNGETHLQTNEFLVCQQFNPFYLAENSNIWLKFTRSAKQTRVWLLNNCNLFSYLLDKIFTTKNIY